MGKYPKFVNLVESPFYTNVRGYNFYFSSAFKKKQFDTKLEPFVIDNNMRINYRNDITIDLTLYFTFALYGQVEKTGFLVIPDKGEMMLCKSSIIFDGQLQTKPNYEKRLEISTIKSTVY